MSPASYLTAPPRDAASSIAAFRLESVPAQPPSEPRREQETRSQNGDSGHRVEHEVVPGDDDRQDDERRVDGAERAHEVASCKTDHAEPDADRVRRVQRGDGRDRVREPSRSLGADVDAGE